VLKLLGSICIFCGGALVWWTQMADCRRELDTLSEMIMSLGRMGEEIRMTRTPLPLLLDRLKQGRTTGVAAFFQEVSKAARQGSSVVLAWQEAAGRLPLESEDRAALREAGACLAGDEAHICQGLAHAAAQLSRSLEEKRRRKPERERRATAMSFSAAALLVILLI